MKIYTRDIRGFSLVEVIVVSALMGLMSAVIMGGLVNMRDGAALEATSQEVYRSLLDARTHSLGALNGSVYTVYIATTSMSRMVGSPGGGYYATSSVYIFDRGVTATSSLMSQGRMTVTFSKLTGAADKGGVIYFRSNGVTTTVSINASGLIQYDI